ncbi:MAG: hypothetical protein DMG59_24980 [Acidobacteria bacterium]|nr:MAG: hypothetical protein DMG59_24980 [Acidobacteriota bacterium]
MNIVKATEKYEAWLAGRIPLIRADLERKHAMMRDAPFSFLRATFYRWAQIWPQVCARTNAPEVLGVGDLHVENFGTWRDIEGRLVWGINDFDEACWLPYTCDLVRLVASAHLAITAEHLTMISPAKASKAILDGYRAGIRAGGRPFVLAEHHTALRQMAVERLKEPEKFWEKLKGLPSCKESVSPGALKGIQKMLPSPEVQYRIVHRVSGLGSLGRRRYAALADWHGGSIAREAKELTNSAWRWFGSRRADSEIRYQEAMDRAFRCPDPFVRVKGRWVVRRLAPDCSRIELTSLPTKHDAVRLLQSMGWETANLHLGTREARILARDLEKRGPGWLHSDAQAMVEATRQDWEEWRKRR